MYVLIQLLWSQKNKKSLLMFFITTENSKSWLKTSNCLHLKNLKKLKRKSSKIKTNNHSNNCKQIKRTIPNKIIVNEKEKIG